VVGAPPSQGPGAGQCKAPGTPGTPAVHVGVEAGHGSTEAVDIVLLDKPAPTGNVVEVRVGSSHMFNSGRGFIFHGS
jgi:hypothetical protein